MVPSIWVNGIRQATSGTHISAWDRGLLLADGVFETMRVHRGTIFRVESHLARLRDGLQRLRIPVPSQLQEWLRAALADVTRSSDLSVRLTVTRGAGGSGVGALPDLTPTVIILVNAMPSFPATIYGNGLTAQVASGRRNERAITAGVKTISYTESIVALLEAQQQGADEALFLDTEGHCSEATASNLFIVRGGVLVTPPRTCAVLPGITRAAVFEMAAAFGVGTAEHAFGLEHLLAADEAFLTSSLRGIAPLVQVDGRPIGGGTPGALTRRLLAAHGELVARECTP